MKFEYLQRVVVDAELDVDNVGDCVLLANNDFGEEYYLIIKTELGWTEILEYGPCVPDLELLPLTYTVTYTRIEYNQRKLETTIDRFLNNPKRGISQAKVCELDEIFENLVNPINKVFPLMKEYKDD